MDYGIFEEYLSMLVLAALAVALFRRMTLPAIVGYLLVGAIFGPHALGLFSDLEGFQVIAQLGVVFLLFTIGLEISFAEINAMRRTLLPLGLGQVVLTTVGIGAMAWLAGFDLAAAFVVGAVLAQSSTSIIGKQLVEQGEQAGSHGRLGMGISVFQDVTAIPFVIVIPALAVGGLAWTGELGRALAIALVVTVVLWALGRWLLRPIFHGIAKTSSLELFTLAAVTVAVGAAWFTEQAGLSLALGGFLAGMVLGETEFQHQVEAAIRPFRDLLLGLFFITIGMQLQFFTVLDMLPWVALLAFGSLFFKALLVWGLCRLAGVDSHQALRTGLILAVGGEFGFALLALALDVRLLTADQEQMILGMVLLSMLVTPFLIRYNLAIADWLVPPRPGPGERGKGAALPHGERDHVVLCGYGRVGQNIAHFLTEENISFVAFDLDVARIREVSSVGWPVYYGDARDAGLLESVGVADARLVVVTYGDFPGAVRTVEHVRSINARVPVLVRCRDENHLERLKAAGATEAISETMEASLMLVSHALYLSGVPLGRIVRRMGEVRAERYRLLQAFFADSCTVDLDAPSGLRGRLRAMTLGPDSPGVGRRLGDLGLAEGVRVTALLRQGVRAAAPDPDARLERGDLLVLFGPEEKLEAADKQLRQGDR